MVSVTEQFSWTNAVWSLGLFVLLAGVIWYKMHLLRSEIHQLVDALPRIGSEFVKREVAELRDALRETRARLVIVEERLGLNGERERP